MYLDRLKGQNHSFLLNSRETVKCDIKFINLSLFFWGCITFSLTSNPNPNLNIVVFTVNLS